MIDDKTNAGRDTVPGRQKDEHIRIVLEEEVGHDGTTLMDDVRLVHNALCELTADEIDLTVEFFGRRLRAPLMITSMTGGAEQSGRINSGLASVASRHGIAFAVGSQKIMLRHPELAEQFRVRRHIPDGVLLGNIGATLLRDYPIAKIQDLIETIDADGLCIHLNPAQELMQENGDRDFRGVLDNIGRLVEALDGQVLVKETGAGLSPAVLKKLAKVGVRYIDVSGAGGTSWTKVESFRANAPILARAGRTFANWGLPTAVSIAAARGVLPSSAVVVGAGGIKTGLDSARAIALGADLTGFARYVLKAFLEEGEAGASQFLDAHIYELKTAMMLTGARTPRMLREVPRVYTGPLSQWMASLWPQNTDVK